MGAAPPTIETLGPTSSQDASPTESHNGDSAADGLMTTAARYHTVASVLRVELRQSLYTPQCLMVRLKFLMVNSQLLMVNLHFLTIPPIGLLPIFDGLMLNLNIVMVNSNTVYLMLAPQLFDALAPRFRVIF